jgi:hypothetical protein
MSDVKKTADWELIERHYRAGILSLRQTATEGGVTESAIRKRAKRDGWSRNLKAKIQNRAEELVRKSEVRKVSAQARALPEKEIIEVNAQAVATVLIVQKGSIKRMHSLAEKLMDELEATTDNKELFIQLGELLDTSGPDENGKDRKDLMNEIYRKVISMGGRIDSAKKLAEILEKVVKLEREAFGIENTEKQASPIDELLLRIARERSGP